MKLTKPQKKILFILIGLTLLTPIGILLPMVFNAGDAWGEWSAETMKDLLGFVPAGLQQYSGIWNAPISDYTLNGADNSMVHQSGYYVVSGIFGATLTYIVTLLISKFIVKDGA